MIDEVFRLTALFVLEARTQVSFSALHRLIEQIAQTHGVTGPGLELLTVFSLHQPKGHMLQARAIGNPASPFGHLEHSRKVIGLTGIGHVDHPAGCITIGSCSEPITNCREIGCGVIEAPITLLHDHRQRLAVLAADPFQEDALCPVVGDQQTDLLQPIDHRR